MYEQSLTADRVRAHFACGNKEVPALPDTPLPPSLAEHAGCSQAVNRRKDAQRLYTLAALQFEKALRLSSVATAPSVVSPDLTCLVLIFPDLTCPSSSSSSPAGWLGQVDDSNAYILAAYAHSVCSVLRLAEVTATSQRWGNLTPVERNSQVG
jgi:hypothetical protein